MTRPGGASPAPACASRPTCQGARTSTRSASGPVRARRPFRRHPCRTVRSGQGVSPSSLRAVSGGSVWSGVSPSAASRVDGSVWSGRVSSPSLRSDSDGSGAGQRRLGRSPATASMRSGSGRCRVLGVRVPLACDASVRSSSPTQASRRMARRSPFPVGTSRPTGPHARDSPTRVAPAGSGACARRRESAHGALRSAPGMLGCVDARARPSRHATTALRRRPRGPETASRSGSPPASSRSALASHDHGGRTFATCSR